LTNIPPGALRLNTSLLLQILSALRRRYYFR
jgi:hypothetical protein